MRVREKLTKPQREELRRQLKEPQSTFGKGRARVQNTLAERGLSEFFNDKMTLTTQAYDRQWCGITAKGIGALCGCGGFVQHGAYVHSDSCTDQQRSNDFGTVQARRMREGVVLLREPFRVNKKLVRESLARADARDKKEPMNDDIKPLSKDELWDVMVKYAGHPSVMRLFATLNETRDALQTAFKELDNVASWSGAAGNWPLQDAVTKCRKVLGLTPGEHLKEQDRG